MNRAQLASILLLGSLLALSGCSASNSQMDLPTSIELGPQSDDQSAQDSNQSVDQSGTENSAVTEPSEAIDESESDVSNSTDPEDAIDFVVDDAELEIEDQSGDGTSVQIQEVKTSLQTGLLVIFDASGGYLGAAKVSSTVQPVSIELVNPISSSQELIGQLFADNGNGVYDSMDLEVIEADEDEREIIYEDFEYEMN